MMISSPSLLMRTRARGGSQHVRSDHQSPIGILAQFIDHECVLDGMQHVFLGDVVAVRRVVDLHTGLVYYEKPSSRRGTRHARHLSLPGPLGLLSPNAGLRTRRHGAISLVIPAATLVYGRPLPSARLVPLPSDPDRHFRHTDSRP
jgi:hypothetical protein